MTIVDSIYFLLLSDYLSFLPFYWHVYLVRLIILMLFIYWTYIIISLLCVHPSSSQPSRESWPPSLVTAAPLDWGWHQWLGPNNGEHLALWALVRRGRSFVPGLHGAVQFCGTMANDGGRDSPEGRAYGYVGPYVSTHSVIPVLVLVFQ